MNKLNILFQWTTLTSVLVAGLVTYSIAQNADKRSKDQKLKIDIEITENGEVKRISKEIDAAEGEDIHQILKDLDIMDGLDITGTGQRLEIKVKKEVTGDEDSEIDLRVLSPDRDLHWHDDALDKEPRAMLGVFISSYNKAGKTGAVVTGIVPGSAAEQAGLKENDVITAFGNTTITSEEQLRDVVREHKVGETVAVKYLRDGKGQSAEVTLGEARPERIFFREFDIDSKGGFPFDDDFTDELFREHLDKLRYLDLNDMDLNLEMDDDAPFLGVTPAEDADNGKGVLLGKVVEGSAAEKMGIRAGDRVIAIDGQAVTDFEGLAAIIASKKAGDELEVTYDRDGKTTNVKGELGKRSVPDVKRIMRVHTPSLRPGLSGKNDRVTKEVNVIIELQDATKEEEQMLAKPAAVDFRKELAINRIEFSPNPSNGQFDLTFELPEKKDTRVLVLDQMGRKVNEEILRNFSGIYRNQIDISSQPNGVYFLIIAQGEKQFTRKIIKQ